MKLSKFFTLFGVTSGLVISNFSQPNLGQLQAQSSSKNALIVFVNGSGDCCAEEMNQVRERVEPGNTLWTTSYANFRNGSTTTKVPVVNLSTNADALFIKEATKVINSQPPDRPIVLIGHSYGGDSILKVLPFITRRVQLVVVIDPVGTGGFRRVATSRVVPPNVDYFINRWQENGLTGQNIVPFDSRINGQIRCTATKGCDQAAQNLVRKEDGSEVRVSCGWAEVTCRTKAKRIEHNSMPEDAYIQKTVGDRIAEVLAAFRPPTTLLQQGVDLYRTIVGRDPEPGAAEGVANRLANGSTLAREREIMANSEESRNNLANLYRTILGREPEPGAVDGLVSRLAKGSTLAQEREIMTNSEEAKKRRGL